MFLVALFCAPLDSHVKKANRLLPVGPTTLGTWDYPNISVCRTIKSSFHWKRRILAPEEHLTPESTVDQKCGVESKITLHTMQTDKYCSPGNCW